MLINLDRWRIPIWLLSRQRWRSGRACLL